MQHSKNKRTLGRSRSQRTALMRGLAISLFENGKIVTTDAKARELRPFAEKLITAAKTDSIAKRRQIASVLGEPKTNIVNALFTDIAPKYQERAGGYTRIIKMGQNAGRTEAVIELV